MLHMSLFFLFFYLTHYLYYSWHIRWHALHCYFILITVIKLWWISDKLASFILLISFLYYFIILYYIFFILFTIWHIVCITHGILGAVICVTLLFHTNNLHKVMMYCMECRLLTFQKKLFAVQLFCRTYFF